MINRWNETDARPFLSNPLALRAYTSRLLGQEEDLVLHGGGNTSVKHTVKNIFGQEEKVLSIKGSGYDLKTLPIEGLSSCRMSHLLKLAELPTLTDLEMGQELRTSLISPQAPNPSVETIVHALIPFEYVDHTHADAIVAISNTPQGEQYFADIFGPNVLVLPYIMPGFVLAKQIAHATKILNWKQCQGIILLHHGIITFSNSAKESYDNMISLVSKAEQFLQTKKISINGFNGVSSNVVSDIGEHEAKLLSKWRKQFYQKSGKAFLASFSTSPHGDETSLLSQGPLTPDHVIYTKRVGGIVTDEQWVEQYCRDYQQYFEKYGANKSLTMLDPLPRYAVWPGRGVLHFASNPKSLKVVEDILAHTRKSHSWSQQLGGLQCLPAQDIFDVEYWELEQAKLKKGSSPAEFEGRVVLVTGAASGIGKAMAQKFLSQGAAVVGLDLSSAVQEVHKGKGYLGIVCDVTRPEALSSAILQAVSSFGGIDIVVSNAGHFPPTTSVEEMTSAIWQKSLDLNLTSHQILMSKVIPYLKQGIQPSIILVASKNVLAPGPGASSYSVAKAGLTQLGRVLSLELAGDGIRVYMLHPDAVFDTQIWTEEVLAKRAEAYGLTVDQYKKKNLLKTEISSMDVAAVACTLASSVFSKSTGLQISVDGGNDRVI